jgi:hypothetical protein
LRLFLNGTTLETTAMSTPKNRDDAYKYGLDHGKKGETPNSTGSRGAYGIFGGSKSDKDVDEAYISGHSAGLSERRSDIRKK